MGTSARHSVAVQSAATVLPHQPPFLDREKRHVVLGTPIYVAHADATGWIRRDHRIGHRATPGQTRRVVGELAAHGPSVTDWMTAIGQCVAAGGAVLAVWFMRSR
jgi:hypothetical protein